MEGKPRPIKGRWHAWTKKAWLVSFHGMRPCSCLLRCSLSLVVASTRGTSMTSFIGVPLHAGTWPTSLLISREREKEKFDYRAIQVRIFHTSNLPVCPIASDGRDKRGNAAVLLRNVRMSWSGREGIDASRDSLHVKMDFARVLEIYINTIRSIIISKLCSSD